MYHTHTCVITNYLDICQHTTHTCLYAHKYVNTHTRWYVNTMYTNCTRTHIHTHTLTCCYFNTVHTHACILTIVRDAESTLTRTHTLSPHCLMLEKQQQTCDMHAHTCARTHTHTHTQTNETKQKKQDKTYTLTSGTKRKTKQQLQI